MLVFVLASAAFALLTISPFLTGHFPEHDEVGLFRKHNTTRFYLQNQQNMTEFNSSDSNDSLPLARGSSGLPMSLTPALLGAKHGSITCSSDSGDFKLDELAYWNEPGPYDTKFASPFAPKVQAMTRYVTFEPDR